MVRIIVSSGTNVTKTHTFTQCMVYFNYIILDTFVYIKIQIDRDIVTDVRVRHGCHGTFHSCVVTNTLSESGWLPSTWCVEYVLGYISIFIFMYLV